MKASSSRSQKLFKTIFTSMAAPDIEPTGSGLDTDRQARSRLRHAVRRSGPCRGVPDATERRQNESAPRGLACGLYSPLFHAFHRYQALL